MHGLAKAGGRLPRHLQLFAHALDEAIHPLLRAKIVRVALYSLRRWSKGGDIESLQVPRLGAEGLGRGTTSHALSSSSMLDLRSDEPDIPIP